ncbi:hypothetical protein ACF8GD_25990 [Pseudomonas putida]|uniref:hypothetical protein n=1 Tax=Pseudomonas putida TaxID=303 RepID=UPI00370BAE51
MIINFSPVRMDEALVVYRDEDRLDLNGVVYDFGPLTEKASIPQAAISSKWFAGEVERIDGELVLTLVLPHGASAPEETRFPRPIRVNENGPITLPAYNNPAEPDEVLPFVQDFG